MQAYEVFWASSDDLVEWLKDGNDDYPAGWYWWPRCPGCLPDGPPLGPYGSEAEALAGAQNWLSA